MLHLAPHVRAYIVQTYDLICSQHIASVLRNAVSVPLETRQVLQGHEDGDIATHYSAPEIMELIDAVERLVEGNVR